MKTIYCLVAGLLLTSTTLVSAQSRFSVGLTAAPVFNHSSFTVADPSGQLTGFDFRSDVGGAMLGLSAQYAFTPQWSLSSGVWFQQLRSTGVFPFATGIVSSRIISSVYQVPLLLNFRPTNRRLSPFFSVGTLGTFGSSTLYKPADGSGLSNSRVRFSQPFKVNVAIVGAGVAYRLTPHWSLTAQPLLIWRFKPQSGNFIHYERFVSYQINGQAQLLYSF